MLTCNHRLVIRTMIVIVMASFVSSDPDFLQDVCVANLESDVTMNGFPCKQDVSADDFFFDGLSRARHTNNTFGVAITLATVLNITGLNTLGVSMARVDYAPGGINPPHIHPRATEIVFVLEGELDVSFITTDNKLYSKSVRTGDVFVFPRGLIHFQKNKGNVPAAVIAAFNSQFPGTQRVPNALFVSSPGVPDDVLAKSFKIGTKVVKKIKTRLAPKK